KCLELSPDLPELPIRDAALDDLVFVDEYVNALSAGRHHVCSGVEGRHVLEVLMGVFESIAYGVRVNLPQERRDNPLLRWRRDHGLGSPEPTPRPYEYWLRAEDRRLGKS
ncbi:hypothetical protein MK139_14885, partial [bacterium]|nr:hypothetical protein [bacterium]